MKIPGRAKMLFMTTIGMLIMAACIMPPLTVISPPTPTPTPFVDPAHNQTLARLTTVLTASGNSAQDLLYSCLLHYYQQGIPLDVATELCTPQVLEADNEGFGGAFDDFGDIGGGDIFDPTTITASCSAGDPGRGVTGSEIAGMIEQAKAARDAYDRAVALQAAAIARLRELSANGGATADEEAEALAANTEAIVLANEAAIKYEAARTKLVVAVMGLPGGAPSSASSASSSGSSSSSSSFSGSSSSSASSGSGSSSSSSSSAGQPVTDSACEEALQHAREFLYECHRTGWKSYQCQQLQAKMHGCPDPALILVDPEQGYTCGTSPDAKTLEALKNAWVERCESRKQFDPSGPNPCQPPEFDKSQLTGKGKIGDVCNDPAAYVLPENSDCVATFEIRPFGEVNPQQIAVWGLNKLGGPIIVLPPRGGDSLTPGPQPPTQ
jgi:hypothetical protein